MNGNLIIAYILISFVLLSMLYFSELHFMLIVYAAAFLFFLGVSARFYQDLSVVLFVLFSVATFLFWFVKRNKSICKELVLNDFLHNKKEEKLALRVGMEGTAVTSLKPVGFVKFEGEIVEVVANKQFLYEHTKVRIIKITEAKIIVEKI